MSRGLPPTGGLSHPGSSVCSSYSLPELGVIITGQVRTQGSERGRDLSQVTQLVYARSKLPIPSSFPYFILIWEEMEMPEGGGGVGEHDGVRRRVLLYLD